MIDVFRAVIPTRDNKNKITVIAAIESKEESAEINEETKFVLLDYITLNMLEQLKYKGYSSFKDLNQEELEYTFYELAKWVEKYV